MNKGLLLFILFLLHFEYCLPQHAVIRDPYIKFNSFDKQDGLTGNDIHDILQDSAGYLWIATSTGLSRYDGYRFTNFIHDPGDSSTLSDDLVICLAMDSFSNFWVGTAVGLNRYDAVGQEFHRDFARDENTELLYTKHIRQLLPDGNILWIETAKGELFKFNTETGASRIFTHKPPTKVTTYFYHSLMKDPAGRIWLGGRYMGLLNFDPEGEVFSEIKADPKNSRKKRDEDAAVFFLDSMGTYWVGGIDGLYSFDPNTEIFQKHLPVSTFTIAEIGKDELWIGTGDGIYIFNRNDSVFWHIQHNDDFNHSLIHNHINKIYADHSGNLWIGTLDGCSIYQPSKNKFRHIFHIPGDGSTPVSNHITAISVDKKNRIWVGTSDKGAECYNLTWEKLLHYATDQSAEYRLSSDRISTIMADSDGDLWIGQWSGRGFNIVNPETGTNKAYSLVKNSMKADWYNDFLEDREGRFWIGMWGAQGLYRFDKDAGIFMDDRFIQPIFSPETPIKNLAYYRGAIWLAKEYQERFYNFNPTSEKLSQYLDNQYFPFPFTQVDSILTMDNRLCFYTDQGIYTIERNNPFRFGKVTADQISAKKKSTGRLKSEIAKNLKTKVFGIITDGQGSIWAATDKGLYRTIDNLPVARYHRHDEKSANLLSDTIYSIDFEPPGNLWLGTDKGLVKFDIQSKTFLNFQGTAEKYLSSHLIKFVRQDSKGMIWIGTTDGGLNSLNPETENITHFENDMNDHGAFWGIEASCLTEDADGIIWVGGFGLNKFDRKNQAFSHYTSADGLADNSIMAILNDRSGLLWISTANGLSCFDPVKETFNNYYEKDGLQNNEFSGAACRLPGGEIAFGGKNGLNIFDPANIVRNENPPQIAVTGFRIFGTDQSHWIQNKQSLQLRYDQNYFSFEFTALDFSDPANNVFAYKLENFDEEWITTTADNRIARYTNVPPGSYRFRVKAANNDGVWNEAGISWPVIIAPPFWKSTLFYLAIFLFGIIMIYFFIRLREKKIREQNRFLTLEQKLLRSQMNPHFIFNSLSSIQSYIFESNPVIAGSYLSRFAELIRSILYNSREEFITLDKEIRTLRNYLDLQQLRYSNKFDFFIDIDPEIDVENTVIPPMLAQPFIENAIEHGLKDLDRKGYLKISFALQGRFLKILVEDNGIGIEEAKWQNLNKAREHTSLATVITRERIEILNKSKKKLKYSMNISDRINDDGIMEGTIVEFMIPVTLH